MTVEEDTRNVTETIPTSLTTYRGALVKSGVVLAVKATTTCSIACGRAL